VLLEGGKHLIVFTTVLFVYHEGSIPEGSELSFFWHFGKRPLRQF
jgi:hypothetical protein